MLLELEKDWVFFINTTKGAFSRYNHTRIMHGVHPKLKAEQEHHKKGMELPLSLICVSVGGRGFATSRVVKNITLRAEGRMLCRTANYFYTNHTGKGR